MRRQSGWILGAALLLAGVGAAPPGLRAQVPGGPEEAENILAGRLFREGGEQPAGGATVRAYHIATGRLFSTATTLDTGSFLLIELPDGSYELSFEVEGRRFLAPDIITMSGGMRQRVNYALSSKPVPASVLDRFAGRGLGDVPVDGIVVLVRKAGGGAPEGRGRRMTVYLLTAIGSGYVLYEVFDDDEDVSGSTP